MPVLTFKVLFSWNLKIPFVSVIFSSQSIYQCCFQQQPLNSTVLLDFLYLYTSQMPEILHKVVPSLPAVASTSLSQVKVLQLRYAHTLGTVSTPQSSNDGNPHCSPANESTSGSHFIPGPLLFTSCLRFGFLDIKSDQGFRYWWFTEGLLLRKKPVRE